MVRITWDLIRKKAEHHDGLLEDLEELSLHQLNIDKLDTIGRVCPRLKILYLQNNVIGKIENIKRLKSLFYLNLALNNVTSIPSEISRCEKLKKLDLTLNFIDLDTFEASVKALQPLVFLEELYLTGNPCTSWEGYRPYLLHLLPRVEKLDGVDVTRGERIQARTRFDQLHEELNDLAMKKRVEKEREGKQSSSNEEQKEMDDDDLAEAKEKKVSAYTPESRLAMHREAEEAERAKEEERRRTQRGEQKDDPWKEAQDKMNAKVVLQEGDDTLPKQRNMAKYDFTLVEDDGAGNVVVDIELPRFLSTSLIDLDVHPLWFQALIKGKNLLLHFPAEIEVERCKVQRIQATGHLILTCPRVRQVQGKEGNGSKTGANKDGEEQEDEEEGDELEANFAAASLGATPASSSSSSSKSASTVDLSRSFPSAAASSSSSSSSSSISSTSSSFFRTENRGGGLNQVVSDYRHIVKRKDQPPAAKAAQIKELTATRSATLEEARRREQEERRKKTEEEQRASLEAERAELEKLGLDADGIPDLE